jgi:hypothetical protein
MRNYESEAVVIFEEIAGKLMALLNVDDMMLLGLSLDAIEAVIRGSFWSGKQSKMYQMGDGDMLEFSERDAPTFLAKKYGQVIDYQTVSELAKTLGMKEEKQGKVVAAAVAISWKTVTDHVKYHNQRNALEMRVDMFADEPRFEVLDEKARAVFCHKPFEPKLGECDEMILADYREHFPSLDEVLVFIAASRFARDRKRCYLWLQADSDWGKGFFLGAFETMGAVVEVSVKEIEAMFEGKPVGRSMTDFKRAMILAVDEFKSARSEMKQLQSEINISPKNQLTQSVEVFTKLFMSAEDVPSFAGEEGIEAQFVNRFSYMRFYGSMTERWLYQADSSAYVDNIQTYIANFMNEEIKSYVELGRDAAEQDASDEIDAFWTKHGIGNTFQSFGDALPEQAERFIDWLVINFIQIQAEFPFSGKGMSKTQRLIRSSLTEFGGKWYLASASSVVGIWIEEVIDHSVKGSIMYKRADIVKACSVDGTPPVTRRIPDSVKAIEIRVSDDTASGSERGEKLEQMIAGKEALDKAMRAPTP